MKSIILTAAYSFAFAAYFAAIAPDTSKMNLENANSDQYPAATGIMLPEVTISSLPTYFLREVIVSATATLEFTLPEVVIRAVEMP